MKRIITLASLCALAVAIAFVSDASAQTIQGNTVPKPNSAADENKVEVKELDEKSFDGELKNATMPVLVDFTASWCGPCQQLKPKLDKLAQEFKGKVIFTKVEQTTNRQFVANKGVRAFPTLKMYAPGGKEMSTSVGNLPIEQLRDWIQAQVDAHEEAQKSPQPQKQNP